MGRRLPTVVLHPGIVERLRAEDLGTTWQTRLLEAGLLTTAPVHGGEEWSPARALTGIGRDHADLVDTEDRIRAIEVHKPFRSGEVHRGLPVSMLVSLWALTNVIGSLAWGVAVAALGWGGMAIAGLGYMLWFDRRKRSMLAALARELGWRRTDLVAAVEAVFSRSFVARVGGRLLVCEPHRTWCASRLLALPRPAPDDVELIALREDLASMAEELERSREAALADPPQGWVDLSIDVADLVARLDAAGHPPFVPRQELEKLLRG